MAAVEIDWHDLTLVVHLRLKYAKHFPKAILMSPALGTVWTSRYNKFIFQKGRLALSRSSLDRMHITGYIYPQPRLLP